MYCHIKRDQDTSTWTTLLSVKVSYYLKYPDHAKLGRVYNKESSKKIIQTPKEFPKKLSCKPNYQMKRMSKVLI